MSNMAQKRAAKANRRKTIVAQKRQADSLQGSLGERVARAAVPQFGTAWFPITCSLWAWEP